MRVRETEEERDRRKWREFLAGWMGCLPACASCGSDLGLAYTVTPCTRGGLLCTACAIARPEIVPPRLRLPRAEVAA
ncbi:hypothetical protein [uncultured Arsenicicoccus sp.]|uniref:hypothetical protein n=1 Tax=uncultured Arsenicicoccus sp. TaxID=491339 RepID=UPI002594DC16|nr:hypothetical protein [uncultured Arsenicicoccus sp.]